MKKELLEYFDKIDILLTQGDYILFELAFALYEKCDDRSVIEKLTESDIGKLREWVSKYSVISDYLGDKIDDKLGDVI